MEKKIIIAIDGHSSCGKSTMAKSLARKIAYIYVDTGAMYRGITLAALRAGLIDENHIDEQGVSELLKTTQLSFKLNEETAVPELYLNGKNVEKEIRQMRVSSFVSPIATIPAVRYALAKEQQAMGETKGIVMDGRDIGTNVFPNAELKIFLTAQPEVRAKRRLLELQSKGDDKTTFEEVLKNLNERDYIDSHREVAPLCKAEDAIVVDNSEMTLEEQDAHLITLYQEALKKANA